MASLEARVVIQTDEVQEACELFSEWAGRAHELPEALRQELQEIGRSPDSMVEVRHAGGFVHDVVMAPRVRALVANLRAQARAPIGASR